jgi:hypothetical protein
MKKTKFFTLAILIAAIALVALFSACNEEGVVVNDNKNRKAVKFASTEATAQTRVDGSDWAAGDPIGIYMLENGTNTVAEGAENIQYTAKSAGSGSIDFRAISAEKTIYYPVTIPGKVDFITYHPYQSTLKNWIYKVDLAIQDSQTAIDLLWAKADNNGAGYDKTTHTVPLNFAHKLAKLILTVSEGDGVTSLNGLQVSINGTNTNADCDVRTGTLTPGTVPAGIKPWKNASSYQYEAILLPADLDGNNTVTFTIGNDIYTWKISGDITKLEAGKKYNYTVTLNKHSIGITGSITDWVSGGTGAGTAD